MTKKKASQNPYKVWMRPELHAARKKLPGHLRQRIKRAIDSLQVQPRPFTSKRLTIPKEKLPESAWEVRRIRLDNWRIIYGVNETWKEIVILAIEQRPPYDYEDLDGLLSEL